MKVYKNLEDIEFNINRAITVGTFDGVHSGHLSILKSLRENATNHNLRTMVVTFAPHPELYFERLFNTDAVFPVLTTLDEKLSIFKLLGIDEVLVIEFDKKFADLSAYKFITDFLLRRIGFKLFVIGFNNHFGKNQEGDATLLDRVREDTMISNHPIYNIISVPQYKHKNIEVSSTLIRSMISHTNIEYVNQLLGYPYFITSKVIEGNKRGSKLGFPTANLECTDKLLPSRGAYIGTVSVFNESFKSIINIGYNPTFSDDDSKSIIEAHILQFNGNIYGDSVTVSFLKKTREEKRFKTPEELKIQLGYDILECKKYFSDLDNNN